LWPAHDGCADLREMRGIADPTQLQDVRRANGTRQPGGAVSVVQGNLSGHRWALCNIVMI
jgi:hypothetical protein